MNLKVATLTATTVAVAAMLPSIADSNVHTVAAEQTAKAKIGYVKMETLQMYNSPNGTNSVIDHITRDTPVTILETTNEWYKVHTHNKTGYVKKEAISLTKPQTNQYIVNADALNVRSEPNAQSDIITVLPNGKFVTVQEEQDGWYKVIHNGTSGYVKKEFLSNTDQPLVKGITVQGGSSYYVATPTLKVRSGAGTNTAIIGSLTNGTQVQVVESVGTWYKIRYGSGYGYVAQHYLVQGQQQPKQQATPSIPAVFKYPAQGKISSEFDVRWGEMHYGVDIAATGNVPIQAAASGTVVKSYYSTSYGNVVFVAHRINGNLYTTVYAHMKSRAVKAGDTVQTGQLLGYMGNTGHSFGQHLHFELHNGEWNFEKTNAVNPLPFLVR
ncbi:SH3 domain-containing protein [Bacillus sp. WLY-B-L8]|uniref:SH3 domain-containing protein n=1 Tax=Bacillus multifaciens TaxID=3068506 RepID=UPI002741D229|nr:SH3 domain-containing protein [Bacillus sp. WLY-B-L8]MDP7981071.1 SH3 domain-containing protein [Bacillus sp. WLY-B-L8]